MTDFFVMPRGESASIEAALTLYDRIVEGELAEPPAAQLESFVSEVERRIGGDALAGGLDLSGQSAIIGLAWPRLHTSLPVLVELASAAALRIVDLERRRFIDTPGARNTDASRRLWTEATAGGSRGEHSLRANAARHGASIRAAEWQPVEGLPAFPYHASFVVHDVSVSCASLGNVLAVQLEVNSDVNLAAGWAPQSFIPSPDDRRVTIEDLAVVGSPLRPGTVRWLRSEGAAERLRSLALQPGECVAIHGSVDSILIARDPEADWARIESLADLALSLPPFEETSLTLPPGFAALEPFVRIWAIGDDVQRARMIQRASSDDLVEFWERAEPLLKAIDSEMDRYGDAVPEDLVQLSWLAEAAVEASRELAERQGL